ncbi:MAG: hypothetical protein JJD92_16255 [Frankiaceae bacterium]|nr:hypothetical protein [Frankiaceae bacterium]
MPGALLAAVLLCNLADSRITESSGLVASSAYDDLLFTHNDSGDTARFFEIDRSCRTHATFELPGVQARDWEDMSRGPGRTLWLGDIGDNSAARVNGVLVHRVAEPGPAEGVRRLSPTSYRLRYADGPQDAEALLVHPRTGRLLIITKGFAGGGIYAAPLPLRPGTPNVMQRVGEVTIPEVTAGDISPDGTRVVLRNYSAAYEWDVRGDDVARAMRADPVRIPLPASKQGEAISYSRDGRSLIVSSEGLNAPVQEVKRDAPPSTSPAAAAKPPAAPATEQRDRRGWLLAGLAGLVVLIPVLLRSRSRRSR